MDEDQKHIKVMTDEERQAELVKRAEAFLFAEGGSLTMRRLAHIAGTTPEKLAPALDALAEQLAGSALTLIRTDNEVSLAVAHGASDALRESYEKELGREVGDAGLEVIGILLYKGPSTRAQIDYIRGVNSSSTMHTLLLRGLVERSGNPNDGREYIYRPTVELLAHLGVARSEELPEYARITSELAEFESRQPPPEDHHGEPDNTSFNAA